VTFPALLASELRRVLARRVVRVGVAIALAIVLLTVIVATLRSTGTGPGDHTLQLAKLWRVRSGRVEENTLLAMSVYVFILVVGIAATAVGADYRSGTVGTLLTWEPRRVRVALARIAAVALVAIGIYVVVMGVFVAGWALGASQRGSTAGLGADFWPDLAAVGGRSVLVVGLLAVMTSALALLTRSTVGAVIVWFGYLVGAEAVLGQRVRSVQPGLLVGNLLAFLTGVDTTFPSEEHLDGSITQRLAQPGPGFVRILVVTAVIVTLGVLAFRRRDVA
jgi:ABC-2 type transport system permease protein